MAVLGVECTAHTLGIGICRSGKILANEKDMYKPVNEGIVPRKAADHHASVFGEVIGRALKKAKIRLCDIDAVAYSAGPGLGQCLKVGAGAAFFISKKYGKPLIGVNHCQAHLEVSRGMLKMKDPLFVYVSGGNTQIIVSEGKRYRVLGETLDIGVGNLFDSLARGLGFEHAHGSVVAKCASEGEYFELPYTVKGMNFAFSGLLTAALKHMGIKSNEDICRSVMDTAFSELCEASERALLFSRKREMVVCGGVAQNPQLCSMLSKMAAENGVRFGVAQNEFNADNGAMIAYLGEKMAGWRGKKNIKGGISQYWRIDEV